MRFTHYDLGQLAAGSTVVVRLRGTQANVMLLDPANFGQYRRGASCRYVGGRATRSPYRIRVPRSGRWHLAIDLGGYEGSTETAVQVIS